MHRFASRSALCGALCVTSVLAAPAPAPATPRPQAADSTRGLPFLAAPGPADRFTCSNLTRLYGRDLTSFANPRPEPTDPGRMEELGAWSVASALDSTDISLVDAQRAAEANDIPADEKEVLVPPAAGARVGIPGPGAAIAATVGGLALLAKVLVDLFR